MAKATVNLDPPVSINSSWKQIYLFKWKNVASCFKTLISQHEHMLLGFYAFGLVACFSSYAVVLEHMTVQKKGPNEFGVMLICSAFYTLISLFGKWSSNETEGCAPYWVFLLLSFTTLSSSYTSLLALRYVSYPIRILGKTCKPIPIIAISCLFGKRYPLRKYLSVFLLSLGASIFMIYKDHSSSSERNNSLFGCTLLFVSLLFDGATGALEDKYIKLYRIGPFEMMHSINKFTVCVMAVVVLCSGSHWELVKMIETSSNLLVLLGLTGGLGQVFIFLTIERFGALLTSIIGTARKVLTISISIILYGHVFSSGQVFGLLVTLVGMLVNLIRGRSPLLTTRKVEYTQLSVKEVGELGKEESENALTYDDSCLIDEAQGIHMRLMKMNVGDSRDSVHSCNDLSNSIDSNGDEAYPTAIDAVFRATTAV